MEHTELNIGGKTYGTDELMSVRVVAKYLGLSVQTVQDLVSRWELPVYKLNRSVRIGVRDLIEWTAARRINSKENNYGQYNYTTNRYVDLGPLGHEWYAEGLSSRLTSGHSEE